MMSSYLRPHRPGATVFFTVALAARGSDTLLREIEALRHAVHQPLAERPVKIDAWVVLPDHMHCIWTLPEGDADFSTRWGAIKSRFTRRVGFHPTTPPNPSEPAGHVSTRTVGWNPTLRSASKIRKGDAGLWQRRFWEHHIRDEDDLLNHITYCWHNPVKHKLVDHPRDWPFSSYHRDNPIATP